MWIQDFQILGSKSIETTKHSKQTMYEFWHIHSLNNFLDLKTLPILLKYTHFQDLAHPETHF